MFRKILHGIVISNIILIISVAMMFRKILHGLRAWKDSPDSAPRQGI